MSRSKTPLVSIVVPCYNDAEFFEQAVNSALNQTYGNKEVIVVDDGSDALTKAVLQKWSSQVKLITQKNKGQGAARNRGIEEAAGTYILVLDSDDYLEKLFLKKAVQSLKNETVRLVSCHAMLHFEDGSRRVFYPGGGSQQDFLFGSKALGNCGLFRKEEAKKVGGYDEKMRSGWEDWEFYIRLMALGGTCEIIPEILFNYRKRKNTTTSRANANKKELWSYILRKHKELYIENYEGLVDFLLQRIEREELEKLKNTERIDFRIGETLLKPLRFIKRRIF